ncbi:MAG: hypothetical protein FE78DRAFT_32393 [Acidomyces sp. 'richmondensis']|nr:MAG: hypothetical protein FE78DRAFT_32393 [Acidomyces sp. 'richmondensis']
MPGTEREVSRDRDVKHYHSWSESGRSSVPMWDSSDPERAPPPLPIPPGASAPTKANTSAGIAAAAKQIVERARESAPLASYTCNHTPQGSPERSLVKGAHHKRLQSLQTGNVKDLRSYLDGNRSPERSPERPASRSGLSSSVKKQQNAEDMSSPIELTSTPTPASRDPLKDTPTLRPTTRQPPKSIFGENTPPSATMLALQTMQVPDHPLNDITNGTGTPSQIRMQTNYDFSAQLRDLHAIATNLQKEMASLSRRSKDNAIDLISLKEATNQRDEDIRKSLRELAMSVSSQHLLGHSTTPSTVPRNTSSFGGSFLDNKAYNSPPSASKTWKLPRAASAHGFLEDGRVGSPSPYSVEGAASVAMLEKIIREMVTKEGQERLLETLSELLEKSQKENSEAAKKVEELAEFIKEKSQSHALVHLRKDEPPKLELNFESANSVAKLSKDANERTGTSDEVLKLLNRIKESVAHAGGSTNEVKGLVRDLRGEVLGMGRELGRKLDQVSQTQLSSTLDKGIESSQSQQHVDEVQRIVEEGLCELKDHLTDLLRQRAEQDDNTFKQLAIAKSAPDGDEMLAMVKHALVEHSDSLSKGVPDQSDHVADKLDREAILDAVREGLKDFEPNIELQQYGLERDEVLSVLKEGLADYQAKKNEQTPTIASIDKGELFEVMQEALKDFRAPFPAEALDQVKEGILESVKSVLAEQQSIPSPPAEDSENMHAKIVEAVKDGLKNYGPAAPRELEISRDDLFDAVKASLDGSSIPFGGFGEKVLQQMQELIDNMRTEFKQYSAASGRDTEQVLDAVKDGLESLRAEIEAYVDRAQDVTGKDEIVDTLKGGLEQLRADVQGYVAQGPTHDSGKQEMLDYIKTEFEHLHEAVGNSMNSRDLDGERGWQDHVSDVIQAIKEGVDGLKSQIDEKISNFEIEFPTDEINDALKEELEQLKASVLNANAADKNELIETIQDSMGALHAKLNGSDLSSMAGGSLEEVTNAIHTEFSVLKETLQAINGDVDQDAIVSSVKQAIDDLRTQLSGDQSDASAEALGAIREELEKFKEIMGNSLVVGNPGIDSHTSNYGELLQGIQSAVNELKETPISSSIPNGGIPEELLEAMRGEFENLRNLLSTSMIHGGSNEEVLDAIRLGLDDLRGHIEKKLESPDRNQAQQNEMLDAINDGLETLRADVVKTLDKPLDMTVNYEILDTLKDGLANLRADLDMLKPTGLKQEHNGREIVLADGSVSRESSDDPQSASTPSTSEFLRPADLEKMEVMFAQLQIKVEAIDATIQELASQQKPFASDDGAAMKADLANIEGMIKDVQENMSNFTARQESSTAPEGVARKEDTDAIETLLRNTKAQLEEMALPDPATMVTKENLDAVEVIIRLMNEAIEGLADRLENTTAAKADVAVVEVLSQDVKSMLEELRDRLPAKDSEEEKPELMTKEDLDVLGVLCTDIKSRIAELVLPNPDELPSKSDVEQLQGLITDFRESHDKLKDSYESDIAITAKAFDDRKQEFEETVSRITGIKDTLEEIKDDLFIKMGDGEHSLNSLGETLKNLEEKSGNYDPVISEVKEIMEALTREFERAHESLGSMKVDNQQFAETSLEKQAEHRDALKAELGEKLDTLFDGLMSKYDDAQTAAQDKAKVMEEKAAAQAELMESTKTMADELRLSIDTLGSTLTTFAETFPERMDKMTEDSKTVFDKVDNAVNKLDETQEAVKYEHSITREDVAKVLAAVGGIQSDLTEHNPRFLMTLKEVHALIGQHYEHSQRAFEAATEHHQSVRELQEQLKQGFEDTKAAFPALPPPVEVPPAVQVEKYDDSALHQKLDKLIGHAEVAANPSEQIERLDQIHEKVMATAAEVSAFVAAQAKQITLDHENKEKEAEEVALLLERRMVQKDEIEADITVLNEEKDSLKHLVETLRAEREALASQKSRLQADLSSLETALHIRKEELHEMDCKAEAIERRMLEGVMNQSRMLLLTKTTRLSAKKKPQGRDLRVPSDMSVASAKTVTSSIPALKANHSLTMKSRPVLQRNGAIPNSAERRIMSLNEISHNVPRGSQSFSTATPSLVSNSSQALKRSHSVKTHFQRKPDWGAKRNTSLTSHDKENTETLSEEDEEQHEHDHSESRDGDHEDVTSDTGTERRTSYTDTALTYGDESYDEGAAPSVDDRRSSYGTSDLSYGTGSYMTGSELSRDSLASSSAHGVLGVESAIDEEPNEEETKDAKQPGIEVRDHQPLQIEASPAKKLELDNHDLKGRFAPPSDSGLGTDLPTAMLSGTEVDYFKSDAE